MIISTERYRGKFRALLRRRFLSHRWHRKDHRAAIKRHVIAIPRSLLPTHREKEKKRERERGREGGRFPCAARREWRRVRKRVLETSSIWRHRTSGLPMSGFLSHRRDLKASGDTLREIKLSFDERSSERASGRATSRSDFIPDPARS